LPGASLDLAVNVVVVGEGTFPVAYRVFLISPGGATELASVSGHALEDMRCHVAVPVGGA
jgi:hypothetical protein